MKNFIKKLLAIFFPNHCLSCPQIISLDGLFCNNCFVDLKFIGQPKCHICCQPITNSRAGEICFSCLNDRPNFDQAISVFSYNGKIKKIIGSLKYSDQTYLAKKLAQILAQKLLQEKLVFDLISIVPMHDKKLRKRKFNQVALIAKNMAKILHKKENLLLDLIIKTRNTAAQMTLKQGERKKNLRNSFAINGKYQNLIIGKNIILLDDVMTTMSTVDACAKTLKKSGAKKVIILTIARTTIDC